MIKVFYFYFHKEKYYSSSPIINNFKILFQNNKKFKKNNIELTPFLHYLPQYNNKQMLYNIPKDKMAEDLFSAMEKIIKLLPEIINKYEKIIFLAFHPTPFQPFIRNIKILRNYPNVKTLLWQDDLQAYFDNPNYTQKLDFTNHIITPSPIYFQNVAPNYLEKTTFFFYSTDKENEKFCQPWNKRINKIILTGCVNGSYKIRHDIAYERTKNSKFEQITDFVKKPRHKEYNYKNREDLPYGQNYYKLLGQYKGAFFAYYEYPKNFNLAKIIEILSMGCIGFFEFSPLLEKELGLIAYKHYVPCTKNRKLITKCKYYNYFLNDIDGKGTEIAKNGQQYVKDNFSDLNAIQNYISVFNKI
jgi:hypothetical protein